MLEIWEVSGYPQKLTENEEETGNKATHKQTCSCLGYLKSSRNFHKWVDPIILLIHFFPQ